MEKYGIILPQKKLPIYMIGSGGIVRDAHLPAYKLVDFTVAGIFDLNQKKSTTLQEDFNIGVVYQSIGEMVDGAGIDCIYDVAVPGSAVLSVLEQLPDRSHVLIQKPMGEHLYQAKQILELCEKKQLCAGINFQLRYAPFVNEARKMINQGEIGELADIEINVNVFTPWHLWDFLFSAERVEILYHSIHYIDLVRSFLGNPESVFAKTTRHPKMKELASVRSNIILDYGEMVRANILTNHAHDFGLENQQSYIKFEGTKGAIKIEFGVLKNYPKGEPDYFQYVKAEEGKSPKWLTKSINGTWFPHAFIGSMAQVMRAATGEKQQPDNSVQDCIHTMAAVEAAYQSSEQGGVRPSY